MERVYLLPGELHVSKMNTEIATLVGSCVAICLYNRKHQFGGMNHYMLPTAPQGCPACAKHGDHAIDLLVRMMLVYDPVVDNLEATIIGGGNVMGHLGGMGIGENNIAIAQEMLKKQGIKVVNTSLGEDFGRKIRFENWTGLVEVRKIEKSEQMRELEAKKKMFNQRGVRVLIVDDSKTIRDILTEALSDDPGIEVVGQAADPYEAREMMLERDPDLICLDIIMPKMDGMTFLKKLFLYAPKPVIIISTIAQKDSLVAEKAKRIGAIEVIDKEDLKLYQGMDLVRSKLIPKIKSSAAVWVKKKTAEELNSI